VLARAEERGHARKLDRTPDEHAPELRRIFDSSVTDDITLAFEQDRYAGREPDPAFLSELEERWRSLPR
jgi:hypothetical protein